MWTEYIPDFNKLRDIADLDTAIFYAIIWCLVVMSACLSSSIAEAKLHKRKFHTLLGACLPLVYPALIKVSLPTKSKAAQKTKIEIEEEKDELPLDDLNEAYFKSVYIDSEGNHNGPFIIDMEGEILQANMISEVHPDFIIIETTNQAGKSQRLRVPYSKITSCSEA